MNQSQDADDLMQRAHRERASFLAPAILAAALALGGCASMPRTEKVVYVTAGVLITGMVIAMDGGKAGPSTRVPGGGQRPRERVPPRQ